jgi:hypothetical protein
MLLSNFCYMAPTVVVLLAGGLVATSRWPRHPQVSSAILIAIACMLAANTGPLLLHFYVYPSANPRADVVLYYQVIAAIASLVRAAGWGTMLTAIFGWRERAPAGRVSRFQFSIRGLLVVTFVAAVLCGLLRALALLLGESAEILLSLLDDIPVFLCWTVGAWLAWSRWPLHPQVSQHTLIAVGLASCALVLSLIFLLAIPRYYALGWPALLMFMSYLVLWPTTWVFLLVAALGGRSTVGVKP